MPKRHEGRRRFLPEQHRQPPRPPMERGQALLGMSSPVRDRVAHDGSTRQDVKDRHDITGQATSA
ncbi:hypothetical protein MOMMJLID_CDS0068 [Arthrobacter phage 1191A]|nr:hypothetical protein MOMMJLID_CDS0068 [Arthrobacter phage 1191A]